MTADPRDELVTALCGQPGVADRYEVADALLPVVRRYAARQLRDAAAEVRDNHGTASLSAKRIDARADALEADQ